MENQTSTQAASTGTASGAGTAVQTSAGTTETSTSPAATTTENRKSGADLLQEAFAGNNTGSGNSGEGASSADAEAEAEETTTQDAGEQQQPEGAAQTQQTETKKQSKEENAVYAKARRQAEAELKRYKEEFEKSIDADIASAGVIDPYTGKPVTDKKAFDAYLQHLRENALENNAKAMGVSKEQLEALAEQHPSVIAAKEAQRKAAAEKAAAEREAAHARFANDIAEITKMNPDIKSFEDLSKLDRFDDIYGLIKNGYRPNHAYQIVYAEQINQKIRENAEQAARNAVTGKSHLTKAQASGEGQKEVPESIMQTMRELMPGKTDAELRKRAIKYMT